ncbi:MAG TPA: DUF362 domain-containing protein [Pirellulales bacterium]|nr:DUF362 domain-containing protein [Pirellulales bacterium]
MDRRTFLTGAAAGLAGGAALGWTGRHWLRPGPAPVLPAEGIVRAGELGLPGPYPGRVIEVHHPGSIANKKRDRDAIRAMIGRGMRELVGSDDATEAWRRFFSPGDRVGIKVVPVGKPDSISSYEVVQEVIEGLRSAKVRLNDILVFERYRNEFIEAGYVANLPERVHWECSAAQYDEKQVAIDGFPDGHRIDHVAGYDRDVYRELAYCSPRHDQHDDRRFRSHLSNIITRKVDKFISIPVLKDHRSAGVTLSLKNLSHGSVNNVARSHITRYNPAEGYYPGATINQCGEFIPAAVSLPPIRQKAVLQILDGLLGTWEGGPGIWNKTFATWEYQSLLFATDPVALDHVGWRIIDAKRAAEGWPAVGQMGLEAEYRMVEWKEGIRCPSEQFARRQPEHIALAATLGLGVFDWKQIEHRKIVL